MIRFENICRFPFIRMNKYAIVIIDFLFNIDLLRKPLNVEHYNYDCLATNNIRLLYILSNSDI